MTEERDIHQAIADRAQSGSDFAVVVVLKAEGSTPRSAGTKAIVEADGTIRGTIGGGVVEAEAQRCCCQRHSHATAPDVRLPSRRQRRAEASPICGGRMRVLVDPTVSSCREAYAAAARARRRRARGVLLTTVRGAGTLATAAEYWPAESLWTGRSERSPSSEAPAETPLRSEVAETARSALVRDQPELLVLEQGERMEILVEPLLPQPLLVIAGGGHVGQAVAAQASVVGFEILVIEREARIQPYRVAAGRGVRALRRDRRGTGEPSVGRQHLRGDRDARP